MSLTFPWLGNILKWRRTWGWSWVPWWVVIRVGVERTSGTMWGQLWPQLFWWTALTSVRRHLVAGHDNFASCSWVMVMTYFNHRLGHNVKENRGSFSSSSLDSLLRLISPFQWNTFTEVLRTTMGSDTRDRGECERFKCKLCLSL